jgi:hypothetical protein
MQEITHFIGGKHVAGTSGRFTQGWQPMTGEQISRVPLASKAEVRAAVENARAAQPAWAATNPQRRARVLMKFLQLLERDNQRLAEALAREHGKTILDAKGDIQRGVEVVEFACGVPHLMKGEFTDGAGPNIDVYSLRQPLGVVAGITPFNFPAMIPMWKFAPAIACGNAFILKPSERDPSVPLMLAELLRKDERGVPFAPPEQRLDFLGPRATISDAAGSNTRQAIDTLASLPGQAKDMAEQLIRSRQYARPGAIVGAADAKTGARETPFSGATADKSPINSSSTADWPGSLLLSIPGAEPTNARSPDASALTGPA